MSKATVFAVGVLVGCVLSAASMQRLQDRRMEAVMVELTNLHEDQQNLQRSVTEAVWTSGVPENTIPEDPVLVDPSLAMDGYPGPAVVTTDGGVQRREVEPCVVLHDRGS